MNKETLAGATAILLLLFLIFIGPVFTIMALNTVFNLTIPLNVYTWLSVLWLGLVIQAGKTNSKENK